jgi:uncharacterized protein (DUF3084 family)
MATLQKTQDAASRGRTTKPQPAQSISAKEPTIEMIAARAYEIWQANGCQPGHDAENWYQAERELRARLSR